MLARRHGVPFYVAAPTSTVDPDCESGAEIPIEERDADEVLDFAGQRIAPEGVEARHPAFDVTPAELVTAIITNEGIHRAPFTPALREALGIVVEEPVAEGDLEDLDALPADADEGTADDLPVEALDEPAAADTGNGTEH